MLDPDLVLVRYGEITLKDRWTRGHWEKILRSNIAFALHEAGIEHQMSIAGGRIFVHTRDPLAPGLIAKVFGVVSTSPAYSVKPDMAEISRVAVEIARETKAASFAIRPRRSGGGISSGDLGKVVGGIVKESTGSLVDLTRPELEIFIEARSDRVMIFKEVVRGLGGLPLGSQSRMLALISGGIDSPVAAWMMMRRGSPVSLLHFDSRPYADAIERVRTVGEVLSRWTTGRRITLITVPNAKGIEAISARYPRATCVLCRRLMYRVAVEVSKIEEAVGIVTGYSLGQVASQTPENIRAEQVGLKAPFYHPLIAMDKTEITDLARKIGTYQISVESQSCSAVPHKPMTRAKLEDIRAMERELKLKDLALELLDERRIEKI